MLKLTCLALLSLALAVGPSTAQPAETSTGIQIVSALYGRPDDTRQRAFTEELQAACGTNVQACEAFCSRAFVGERGLGFHMPFSPRPVCRVIYRCGSAATRAVEADLNERIALRCAPAQGRAN